MKFIKMILATSFLLLVVSCSSLETSVNSKDTTKPEKEILESHTFIVTGDCRGSKGGSGVNEDILNKIVAGILQEKPDFVLFVGDIIFGEADREGLGDEGAIKQLYSEYNTFLTCMKPVYDAGIRVYNVQGNHEVQQQDPNHSGHKDHRPVWPRTKEVWDNVFKGEIANPQNGPENEKNITFSFLHKNSFIAGLDVYTYIPEPEIPIYNPDDSMPSYQFHRVNQPWLDNQLKDINGQHVFTFTHEPAFKVDHYDCLQGDSRDTMNLNYSEFRNEFWNSLKAVGSRVYFCGHDHGYVHVVVEDGDDNPDNDIHQFIVGTAGAGKNIKVSLNGYNSPFTPKLVKLDNSYGYMVVKIDGDKADLTWKRMYDEELGKFEVGENFSYKL